MNTPLAPIAIAAPMSTLPDLSGQGGMAGLPSLPGPTSATPARARMSLSRRQKAAVIVQLLINAGENPPLADLDEAAQEALTNQIGEMGIVDRDTMRAVVEEFVTEMEEIGLTFPAGVKGALGALDSHLSPATAARLRKDAGVAERGDPWERIATLSPDRLLRVLEEESTEVGAILLSKLAVSVAADLLGRLATDRARELSYAISRTGKVKPETVNRIGLSLASQFDAEPIGAFDDGPVQRVGAILNYSRAATRDDVLAGLEETDAKFAAEVRRAIFTFANIPSRVTPRDIPRIMREIDQSVLASALAYAAGNPAMMRAREFMLESISKRLAGSINEEIEELGDVSDSDGEAAMNVVVGEIRRMVEEGELILVADDPEE